MKALLFALGIGLLIVIVLGLNIAFAFGAYWLAMWAGAPKYVAVIVGIAVFVIGGVTSKIKSS